MFGKSDNETEEAHIQIVFSKQDLDLIKEYAVRWVPKNLGLTRDQRLTSATIHAMIRLIKERGLNPTFKVEDE